MRFVYRRPCMHNIVNAYVYIYINIFTCTIFSESVNACWVSFKVSKLEKDTEAQAASSPVYIIFLHGWYFGRPSSWCFYPRQYLNPHIDGHTPGTVLTGQELTVVGSRVSQG